MSAPTLSPESEVWLPTKRGTSFAGFRELDSLFAVTDDAVLSTRGVLKGVSPKGFRIIGSGSDEDEDSVFRYAYAANAEGAWFVSSLYPPRKLATPRPTELRFLGLVYATDGKLVFHEGCKLPGADAGSLRALSLRYSRDSKTCFHCNRKIPGALPESFRPLCPGYEDQGTPLSADAHCVFYAEHLVPEADGAAVSLLRNEQGWVTGIRDGNRGWTMQELGELVKRAPPRQVELPKGKSTVLFHPKAFDGLEHPLAVFVLLCERGSIEHMEATFRGRLGEAAVLRAIARLNAVAVEPLATVDKEKISITPAGMALARQLMPQMQPLMALVDDVEGLVRRLLVSE